MQAGKAFAECGKRELSVCFIGQFGCIKCDYWGNQNAAELPCFYYGRSIANHLSKLAMPVKLAKMTARKFAAFGLSLKTTSERHAPLWGTRDQPPDAMYPFLKYTCSGEAGRGGANRTLILRNCSSRLELLGRYPSR